MNNIFTCTSFSPRLGFLYNRFFSLLSIMIFAALFMLPIMVSGQIAIPNATAVTQNFDGMGSSATATLPSNWRISPQNGGGTPTYAAGITTTSQAASTGSPNTGGRYNWGNTVGTDRSLGIHTSGSYASPSSIMASYQNTNAAALTSLTISYNLERYRINSAAASVQFFYSLNGSTWVAVTAGDLTFNTGASLYGYPLTDSLKSGITITGLNIANLGLIYLRWNLNTTGANSQGIGIDNISVVASFATPSIILKVSPLSGFTYVVGAGPSTSQIDSVTVSNLTSASGNITITSPTDYEVSLDNTTFAATRTIAYASNNLARTAFWIRLKAGLAVGTYNSQTVTVSAGGVAVSGASDESVTCNGNVTNFFNSLSDVIAVAGSEAVNISSLQNANAPLNIGTGTQVWSFTIRDGGASAPDADLLPTIINSITFAQDAGNSVGNWSQAIKTISLFDGATLVSTGTVTINQVQFTGMSLSVSDNTSKTLTVRLSLNCGIGGANKDHDDFVFSLSDANFTTASSASSSQKTTFAAQVSANGSNWINVVATRLIFSQQPQSNVSINNNFSPAVTVTATDACGNVDTGFVGTISITSTGTMVSSPQTAVAFAGIASFSGIAHTVAATGRLLTASSGALTAAVSNPFAVTTSTKLNSGDLMIVGFDTYVNGAPDIISIANFVPILPSTDFTLANILYDWKAPANVKQDRWYNCAAGPVIGGDLAVIKFIYNGAGNINAGSIICIALDGSGNPTAITINGSNAFSSFSFDDVNGSVAVNPNVNFSSSEPDAVFLMQGNFSASALDGSGNLYRTFNGTIFGGIQNRGMFRLFTEAGNAGGDRVSRVHPSMECVAISTGSVSGNNGNYAYYNSGSNHNDSHRNLIKAIAAYSGTNWTRGTSTGNAATDGDNLAVNNTCSNTFTITQNVSAGLWNGEANTDWFNCNNWDDFTVPSSATDVLITNNSNVLNDAVISYTSPKAGPFDSIANAKSLNIIGRKLTIQYSGATKVNTLNVAGSLTINTNGGLDMNDGVAGTTDGRINLAGDWTNNFTTGLDAGESLVNFNGVAAQTITAPDGETFYNLTNANTSTGVAMANNNANVTVSNILSMTSGPLTINTNTLTLNGTIAGSGTLKGSNTSNLIIGGTTGGSVGTLNFTAGGRLLNNLTLNRIGALASATLGTDLAINTLATITSGTLNAQTNSFSGAGGLTMTGGELQVGRAGVTLPELSGTYSLNAGVVNFTGTGSQTVRAVNYYDLTSTSTGARVMANSGTIGIANAFTKGANAYTFTGSTVDYNGITSNQNITPFTAAVAPGSTYNNLTLSNSLNTVTSKTITAATDVEGDLTLNNSISLRLGSNFLNLKSTATKTARVAPVSNTASIDYSFGAGRFVVERYYPGRRKWRLITAPVTVDATNTIFHSWQMGGASPVGSGTYVTGPSPTGAGGNGLDASPQNNYSLKTYNTVTNVWDGVSNTISNRISGINGGAGLADNIGYFMFVRGDRTPANVNAFNPYGLVLETTLRDTGKIQVQSYDFNGNAAIGQFAVVGNPYASPVDFASIPFIDKQNIANKFYAWDPGINGSNGVGGYVIVDLALGNTTTVPVGQSGVSQTSVIQSKQAIVIQTSGASPKLTFTEAAKSSVNNLNLFRPYPNLLSSLAVNLHATTADGEFVLADGILAQFRNDFSDGLDYLDGQKFGNINETFSIAHSNNFYMLERRKPVKANDTIFLSLRKTRPLPYRFNIMLNKMADTRLAAYLVDTYQHTNTPLNMDGNTWIDFTVTNAASTDAGRFYIVFKKAFHFNNVQANVVKNDVAVQWTIETETEMNRYEVERSSDGVLFTKTGEIAVNEIQKTETMYNLTDMNVAPGIYYYRVKAVSSYGAYEYSEARKVKVIKANSQIYVYPNPVANGVIGLQMGNAVGGRYNIILRNIAGQSVMSKQIVHTAGAAEQINYSSGISDGTYQLEIIGIDKKKIALTVVIAKQ